MKLKNEADVLIAERHQRGIRHAPELDIADPDSPGVDRIKAAEHVEQRALADPGGSHDGNHLAALEREVEVFEHRQRLLADDITLREPGDGDERHISVVSLSASAVGSQQSQRSAVAAASVAASSY